MSTAAVIAAAREVLQAPTPEALDDLSAALRHHDAGIFEAVGFNPETRRLSGARGSAVVSAQCARVLQALIEGQGLAVPYERLALAASRDGRPINECHLRKIATVLRDIFASVNSPAQIVARIGEGYVLVTAPQDVVQ